MEMKTKLAALGLTVGLVGGGAAGVILSSADVSGASSAVVAQDNGSQSSTTAPPQNGQGQQGQHPNREKFLQDALAPLVKDKTITQEQADKVIAALEQAGPKGGEGPGGHGGRRLELDAAAKALNNMDVNELRTDLRNGQTVAQVAQSKGVEPQAVVDAMVAEAKGRLDQAVTDKKITQDQADKRLAEVTQRITDGVTNGFKGGPGHHGGPDGQGGPEGRGGPGGPDGQGGTTTTVPGGN